MGNPMLSIIIPVRNEEARIEECLNQLTYQGYAKSRIEILVVDGMSKDKTREIVTRYSEFLNRKSGLVIRLLDNPKVQRTSALNIGINDAKGDVIFRIDARTIIPPDYIEKCLKTLIEKGADNVGGVQKPIIQGSRFEVQSLRLSTGHKKPSIEHRTLTQMAIGIALSHPFGIGDAQFRLGKRSGLVDTVYPGCFRKEIFNKVGLFDEESPIISEDSDMNYRIRKAGGKVYLNKDIVAYYYPRDTFKDLWKLYFRYGGAKAGNLIKRGRLTAWRQLVPATFLLSLIVLPILGISGKMFLYLWFFIVGSYITIDFFLSLVSAFTANISNFLPLVSPIVANPEIPSHEWKLSLRQRLSLFWRLQTVFPTIHFSWALGFWRRLLERPKLGEYWGY
jgi:glycosyltransferase involved in cell wall biosynthesis